MIEVGSKPRQRRSRVVLDRTHRRCLAPAKLRLLRNQSYRPVLDPARRSFDKLVDRYLRHPRPRLQEVCNEELQTASRQLVSRGEEPPFRIGEVRSRRLAHDRSVARWLRFGLR